MLFRSDTISFPLTNTNYRILINKHKKLVAKKIEDSEALIKPCKITGKKLVKGKMQLNLFDGRNVLIDKDDYKVCDTVIFKMPKQDVSTVIKLEKGTFAYLIGGSHCGETGKVEDITEDKIFIKSKNGDVYETSKNYAYALGKEKQIITLLE